MTPQIPHRLQIPKFLTSARLFLEAEIASLAAGLVAAYLSFAFLYRIGFRAPAHDTNSIYFGVICSCLLLGLLFWQNLVTPSSSRAKALGRGVGVGLFYSVLAHPLAWLVALVVNSLTANAYTFVGTEWNQSPMPIPLVIFLQTLGFSFYSLFYVGWITALVGGAVGGSILWLHASIKKMANLD